MSSDTEALNTNLVNKYRIDNTIQKSYFQMSSSAIKMSANVFPLRLDNRQYCSPTDYQGQNPSCCGYSAAQILESMYWMEFGTLVQFNANQIYAKAKETDQDMKRGGTYPDLAMMKGLELIPEFKGKFTVKSQTIHDVNALKRIIHKHMFACVNMNVSKDLYDLNPSGFVYRGTDRRAGGHSLVCCGYDDPSKMLIIQNHWGKSWGMKGFFLCPYDVWIRQGTITCWYERQN